MAYLGPQKLVWDAAGYADNYSRPHTPTSYFFRRRLIHVMRALHSVEKGAIVDVGCGPGIYAKPCCELGFRYTGLDISRQMIEEAQKRFGGLKGVEFKLCDSQHLPVPSNCAEAVLCLGMLEYVPEEDEALYLRDIIRITKPGGLIIFSFLNRKSPYWFWGDYLFPPLKFGLKNLIVFIQGASRVPLRDCHSEINPTRKFVLQRQTRLLRDTGLCVVGAEYFALDILPPQLSRRFQRQAVWLSRTLEHLLQSKWFGWLGMAFLIVARKP
jgi:ubiquinone/menaquinone biosynthesis C-methylase UbiE